MTSSAEWLQQAPLLTADNWRHGWTTTLGPDFVGDPASEDHFACVKKLVQNVDLEAGAWARQVHGGRVLQVSGAGFAGEADALWTDQPGLGVDLDCSLMEKHLAS